ncbi:MAG: hypothetical protein IIB94_01780 [Candidatus Marinimicrobia bacterium]|nr:hypothetical protein [Candidatus Neomarinimicrobiota bacterium]
MNDFIKILIGWVLAQFAVLYIGRRNEDKKKRQFILAILSEVKFNLNLELNGASKSERYPFSTKVYSGNLHNLTFLEEDTIFAIVQHYTTIASYEESYESFRFYVNDLRIRSASNDEIIDFTNDFDDRQGLKVQTIDKTAKVLALILSKAAHDIYDNWIYFPYSAFTRWAKRRKLVKQIQEFLPDFNLKDIKKRRKSTNN